MPFFREDLLIEYWSFCRDARLEGLNYVEPCQQRLWLLQERPNPFLMVSGRSMLWWLWLIAVNCLSPPFLAIMLVSPYSPLLFMICWGTNMLFYLLRTRVHHVLLWIINEANLCAFLFLASTVVFLFNYAICLSYSDHSLLEQEKYYIVMWLYG